ncbi:carboxylesterase/lipase family protein [Neorhizobium sp. LjRoot104]|uniref:carboxylesterase/lipase family protein n=1 Tax=Neorhizobium sp. LjRoot104 TaxID=3342254 RepID=UPI003ECF9224
MTAIDISSDGATYRGLVSARGLSFLGIPYGQPPVGTLRFQPPQAVMAKGLVDATQPGKAPPQIRRPVPDWTTRNTGFETGEDCLNLNVFTPAADDASRPVIVHVLGGGFQTGSVNGGYQDELGFITRGDVVFVRPNFRTGALGFLHLGDVTGDGAPANRGMLDLVLALEWVQAHIADFGGDPGNVTLVGLSSGGFTIGALFGMDGVAHLFRRAWMMSGSASRIIDPQTASGMALDFLQQAGIEPENRQALENLPVETILAVQERIIATDLGERNSPGGRTMGIVLDGTSLKRHPLEGLASGAYRDKQMVVGWTRDEARMWYAFGIMQAPQDRARVLSTVARFFPDRSEAVLAELEKAYPQAGLAELEERFLSATIYRDAAQRTASTHANAGGRAFAYEFAWVPDFEGGRLGSSHGFDEPFVFGNVEAERVPLAGGKPDAVRLAYEMSGALLEFAKTGRISWKEFATERAIKQFG